MKSYERAARSERRALIAAVIVGIIAGVIGSGLVLLTFYILLFVALHLPGIFKALGV